MTTTLDNPRRRWFRFSLRSLLLLVLVISVSLGWTIYKVRQQGIAVAALKEMGCSVDYRRLDKGSPTLLEGLRKLLGEKESRSVTRVSGLYHTDCWSLSSSADAGLKHVSGLTQLRLLNVYNTKVTDAGLVHLEGLTQLEWLSLSGTQVTDAGVQRVQKALPKCEIKWQR